MVAQTDSTGHECRTRVSPALSLSPRDASTAVELAKCLVTRGQLGHAASESATVLHYSTGDGKAREMLAGLLVQLGQPDEAIAFLNDTAWVGASVKGRFSRAHALAEQDDYSGAVMATDRYVANGGTRLDDAASSQRSLRAWRTRSGSF